MAKIIRDPINIEIDIPDILVGNLSIKRKATLSLMIYNQEHKYLTLSWTVSYPDLQGIQGLMNYQKESIADNTTIVDVNTGTILSPIIDHNGDPILDEDGNQTYEGDYIGQYDWFNMIAENQPVEVHNMIRQYGMQADWSI